jgi:hypothetical protein
MKPWRTLRSSIIWAAIGAIIVGLVSFEDPDVVVSATTLLTGAVLFGGIAAIACAGHNWEVRRRDRRAQLVSKE